MAIGWMTSVRDIPWSKVTSAATTVAEGAKKLWERVSKRSTQTEATAPALQAPLTPADAVVALQNRVQSLEKKIEILDEEAVSSFEVVRSLTDNHSRLVDAVDRLIVRTRVLLRVSILLGIAVVALLVVVMSR